MFILVAISVLQTDSVLSVSVVCQHYMWWALNISLVNCFAVNKNTIVSDAASVSAHKRSFCQEPRTQGLNAQLRLHAWCMYSAKIHCYFLHQNTVEEGTPVPNETSLASIVALKEPPVLCQAPSRVPHCMRILTQHDWAVQVLLSHTLYLLLASIHWADQVSGGSARATSLVVHHS